jgi:hypothetical protein
LGGLTKKKKDAYDDMKSPASISLSISKVYNEKKPKYFLRAGAEVEFKVLYIMYEDGVNITSSRYIRQNAI